MGWRAFAALHYWPRRIICHRPRKHGTLGEPLADSQSRRIEELPRKTGIYQPHCLAAGRLVGARENQMLGAHLPGVHPVLVQSSKRIKDNGKNPSRQRPGQLAALLQHVE